MAVASIQITQGAIVAVAGRSVFGFDPTTAIVLTDAGGGGATSWAWEFLAVPGPVAVAPVIANPSDQVATITPAPSLTDGMYIVKLTRNDPVDGVSTQVRWFAVADDDGLHLPVAGASRTNSQTTASVASADAGWFGAESASTNVLLDAFLRLRKVREGRYRGRSTSASHAAGGPVTGITLVYKTALPIQRYTLTGAGTYTVDLSTAVVEDGASFTFFVTTSPGAGNFILRSGIAGATILTIPAPYSETTTVQFSAGYTGAAWSVWPTAQLTGVATAFHSQHVAANISVLSGMGSSGTLVRSASSQMQVQGTTDVVLESGAANYQERRWSGSGGQRKVRDYFNTIQTSAVGPTVAISIPQADATGVNVWADITAYESTTSTAGYLRAASVRTAAGVSTIVGAVTAIHTAEDNAGLNATITVSGNNINVEVTGLAGPTIRWEVHLKLTYVSA